MKVKCPICGNRVAVIKPGVVENHAKGGYTQICLSGPYGDDYKCIGSGRAVAAPKRR